MDEAHRDACVAAAEAGARVLLRHWRRLDASRITEKTRHDLVSEADRESEAAIQAELARRFPAYAFLGEETGASGPMGPRWIVDPLDGTLNFVQGFPHWAVSVALWDGPTSLAGCVLDPLRGDCFTAARGRGATWNGAPAHVSQQAGLEGAFLATGFAYQLGDRFPSYAEALARVFPRAKAIRRAGSAALDLAHTAVGIYDGYFELGLQPWDLAAGVLLVTEAGGQVTDWTGGDTWRNSGNVLAGPAGVLRQLAETVR
jgi:myo-inositol-1(or 4)-monophosphatase